MSHTLEELTNQLTIFSEKYVSNGEQYAISDFISHIKYVGHEGRNKLFSQVHKVIMYAYRVKSILPNISVEFCKTLNALYSYYHHTEYGLLLDNIHNYPDDIEYIIASYIEANTIEPIMVPVDIIARAYESDCTFESDCASILRLPSMGMLDEHSFKYVLKLNVWRLFCESSQSMIEYVDGDDLVITRKAMTNLTYPLPDLEETMIQELLKHKNLYSMHPWYNEAMKKYKKLKLTLLTY